MKWFTITGKFTSISEFISENFDSTKRIFIGTDSQKSRKLKHKIIFCTCIAVLNIGKGGKAIKNRIVLEKFPSLRDRLMHETWLSIQAAQTIETIYGVKPIIHLDVNPNPIFKSGQFKSEIVGYVSAFGYDYEIKPNAWCASSLADYEVQERKLK